MTTSAPLGDDLDNDLARIFRAESGRILALLMMQTPNVELAEDALHDAFLNAAEQWPNSGLPRSTTAWLLTVARRRLIDRCRKESHRSANTTLLAIQDTMPESNETSEEAAPIPDERLRLIFVCCHPALAEPSRIALTLKTLCGLSVREIARAFLTSEVTMNQRLTRAKRKIRNAGIAYEVPEGDALSERLSSVLAVVYLIYNESYSAYEGHKLSRTHLAEEAIRLARILHKLLPRPDVSGLLALLLLNHAREPARSSDSQAFIPLESQDRMLWDQVLIKEGTSLLLATMSQGRPDSYQLQAAISALHAMALEWATTDWLQIQELYALLYQLKPSPVVALNQAVACASSGNLEGAYARLMELEIELSGYQPFYAARADLSAKLGKHIQSLRDYDMALSLTNNSAERDFLLSKRKYTENLLGPKL